MINLEIPFTLIDITEKIGKDINLVQGPGGNISYKHNGFMYVKASGTKMSDVKKKNIFVKTDYRKIIKAIESEDENLKQNYVIDNDSMLPSIETSMHALMPHKCVLHVHCVNTLSWVIQENYHKKISYLLKDENWSSIPYIKPGICLSKEIKNLIKKKKTDVILLSNHGIVVGSNTPEEAYSITKRISEKLYLGELKSTKVLLKDFDKYLSFKKYKLPKYEYVHNIAFSNRHSIIAANGDLFPDQIVFLKNGIKIIESISDLESLLTLSNEKHPVILIPNQGLLVPDNFKEVNEITLFGLAMVISRIPQNSSIKYLTKKDRSELLNWDLEKLRQKINNE